MRKVCVKEYIDKLKEERQINEIVGADKILDNEVLYLSYNSKDVKESTMFVCKGATFKEEYLKSAISNGAFVYVSDKKYDVEIPGIIVDDIQITLSILSNMYFDFPNEKLNIIGITGTKGKSTTAYYIKYILDEYSSAVLKNENAIISSIDTYDGVEKFESHLTTPESYELQKHFRNAVDSEIDSIIMEVSSQALKYSRVHNVEFDYGIFLNISEDHISPMEHENLEDYFTSKLKIFKKTKTACINLDSEHSDRILKAAVMGANKVVTCSSIEENADFYAYNIHKDKFDTIFNVKTPTYDKEFVLTMPGLFNVENALAAIAVAYEMGVPEKYIYTGLRKARSSGRMEIYKSEDEKIIAIVDYAHNKLSFEKLYESVKSEYKDRKIITVFGCPGKKAILRRKDLGLLAGKNSDMVYICAEDPGLEPVEVISNEIASYVSQYTNNYQLIEDRGEAIKEAVKKAASYFEGTVILITGKGNETRQKYGTEYLPCKTDVEYAKMYLSDYSNKVKTNKV